MIIEDQAKAYPVNNLPIGEAIKDKVGSSQILVSFDAEKRHPQVTGSQGEEIPTVKVFWFAWQAFYPETKLWKP